MRIRFVKAGADGQWDELLVGLPAASTFYDWSWLQLQARLFGWRFEPYLVQDDGQAIGVLPIFRSRRGSPRARVPTFVGPLVPDEALPVTLRAIRRWQFRKGLLYYPMYFGATQARAAAAAISATRFVPHSDRTFLVDLHGSSPDKIWADFNQNARRSIRKAERQGVEVRSSEPGELTALLPRVLREAFGRRGQSSPYPESVGEQFESWSTGRDDVFAATALVNGEAAGVICTLASRPVAVMWAVGALRKYKDANPDTMLYYKMLLWALSRGQRAVDLVGYVDEGVAQFKRSLGGVEHAYILTSSALLPETMLRQGLRLPFLGGGG